MLFGPNSARPPDIRPDGARDEANASALIPPISVSESAGKESAQPYGSMDGEREASDQAMLDAGVTASRSGN